jgi:hypothetical protein
MRSLGSMTSRRLTAVDVWPLLQATAAAVVAWVIASRLARHHEPFFAPVAAIVSLNASIGERGLNAVRLLLGVVVGIACGELTLLVLGGGFGALGIATFAALLAARALGGVRIVLAQAAIGAILTVAVAEGEVGVQRLLDALIGAGVALVFSQVLFSPEPVRLLRRFETNVLAAMAAALELTARALAGDSALAEPAVGSLRELRDHLSELARMRRATTRTAKHSLVWRGQIAPLVRETEDAGHLDLLGGSCLMLTRTTLVTAEDEQRALAPCIDALSQVLGELAPTPGDRTARQDAVERALDFLRELRAIDSTPSPELTSALAAARVAVVDLLLFAGVDGDEARAATRELRPELTLDVPAPPSDGDRRWLGWMRRLLR